MFHSIILVAGVRGVWTYWMGGSGDGVMSQVSIIRRTNVPLRRDTFLLHLQFQEDTILLLMIQSWTFMQCKGVKKVQHRIVSFIMPVKVHSIIYISSCKNNSLVPQL